MALKHTGKAIGQTSALIREYLARRHPAASSEQLKVHIGRPERLATTGDVPAVNLFLYEAVFDASMKNLPPMDTSRQPMLWLSLNYLITAFDSSRNSDSMTAQGYLGEAARVLQEMNYIEVESMQPALDPEIVAALKDNPEPLKITFNDARLDLVSRVFHGDERFRFSLAFQARPVMIATEEPPTFSLLVGVDYSAQPNVPIAGEGIHIDVLPSLGPKPDDLHPSDFAPGDTITIFGEDMNLSNLHAWLGDKEMGITSQRPDKLTCKVPISLNAGTSLSPGGHSIILSQDLGNGKSRRSAPLLGFLRPSLTGASIVNKVELQHPILQVQVVTGDVTLTGTLLGTEKDDILLGFMRDGKLVKSFQDFTFDTNNPQGSLAFSLKADDVVPPAEYLLVLRVNGRQSHLAAVLDLR